MNPTYAVYTHIAKPVETVFQAVVKKESFAKVFFQESSADLIEGTTVTWGTGTGSCDVTVERVIENQRIEMIFRPADFAIPELRVKDKRDYDAKLVFIFEEAEAGGTLVTLCEYGWQADKRSVLQSYGHCSGWQEMLLCLKAQLMYDIDLRSPASARPNYAALWLE